MEQFDEAVGSQYGYLTTEQALAFFGEREFKRRVKNGDLIRELQGFYRVAGVPKIAGQELYLATFVYDSPASHKAAATLRGFQRYERLRLEITVAAGVGTRPRSRGLNGLTIHRSNFLPDEHIELVRGIATTTAARTICDLSRFLMASSLGRILDDATRRELVTNQDVATCRNELRARGRRRTTVLDELLLARGVDFDPLDSNPELKLRSWLEDAGLNPVPQFPVIINGERRVLDFAFPEERVATEYFGIDPHSGAEAVMGDSARTTELQLAGWLVVIITKRTGRKRAVEMVKEALDRRRRGLD